MEEGVHHLDARAPEGIRLYAVGDVHGCYDLLVAMHRAIMAEILRDRPEDWRIIYLGDYTDRGPDSRSVVEFLSKVVAQEPRVVALAGNHDVGLLEFLATPDPYGMFALNGGAETLRSYGVVPDFSRRGVVRTHQEFAEAMPEAHLAFLRSLRFSVTFGDFFFCHAGIRPEIPLEQQSPDDLVWIRREFHAYPQLHPKVIVHGHTPVSKAEVLPNRINLDTGACFGGPLTALAVEGREKRLLKTER